jgi:hypothetical protein
MEQRKLLGWVHEKRSGVFPLLGNRKGSYGRVLKGNRKRIRTRNWKEYKEGWYLREVRQKEQDRNSSIEGLQQDLYRKVILLVTNLFTRQNAGFLI